VAKFLGEKLPVQFPEYKKQPSQMEDEGGRRASIAPMLEFTDLTDELKDIVAQVVSFKTKGIAMSRDTIYDVSL